MQVDIGAPTESCIASQSSKLALDALEPVFKHIAGTDCCFQEASMTGINASIQETVSWTCKLTEQATGTCTMCHINITSMRVGHPENFSMIPFVS